MKKLLYPMLAMVLALPVLSAQAQFSGGNPGAGEFDSGYFEDLIGDLIDIVNLIIPLLIAVAVVVFFYGLIRFILAKGPDAKDNAKGVLLFGLLAIFVMVTLWGIIFFFASVFNLGFGAPASFTGPQVLNPGN